MEGGGGGHLVAIVTGRPEGILPGGLPVFVREDEEERRRLATFLAKIVQGMVHELEGGTYVIARH